MKLYLLRHGQTEGNAKMVIQGWTPTPLTAQGKKQAERLRDALADVRFDRIFSSDIYRTRQTGDIVFPERYVPFEYDARLREVNNTALAGTPSAELRKIYGDKYRKASRHLSFEEFGGESAEELMARTKDFLDDLAKDKNSKLVAAVTHGGTIRAFVANVIGGMPDSKSVVIDNCTVTALEYDGKIWRLIGINDCRELH